MNSSLPVPQEVREAMQQALDALSASRPYCLTMAPTTEYDERDKKHQAAIASLRAALLHAQRVAPISDERKAFERWFESDALMEHSNWFRRDEDGDYSLDTVQSDWRVWKARALLAEAVHPSPAPQEQPQDESLAERNLRERGAAVKSVAAAGVIVDAPDLAYVLRHALDCIKASTEYRVGNPAFEHSELILTNALKIITNGVMACDKPVTEAR